MQRFKQRTAIKIKKEVGKKPDYEDMCVVAKERRFAEISRLIIRKSTFFSVS